MSRHTVAPQTIAYLQQKGGADWEEIADHFGITRIAVTARIRAARTYMVNHHSDKCIPRPTRGTGFKYQVTDKMYATEAETSVGRSSVDDLQMVAAISNRLVSDCYVAFDAIPAQQRQTVNGRAIRSMIGALENVSTVCSQHQRSLRRALTQY